jgi:hypothetical protein
VVAGAYDLVGDAEKRKRFDSGDIDAAGAERPRQDYYREYASSEQDHPYTDNSGFADFMDSEDAFAELLRRSARAQANRRGHNLEFRLQIEFIESIAGANKRLTLSDGSTLDVAIPPGITDGQVLRLRGKGAPGSGKAGIGDALIEVEIKPDRLFTRQGDDIYLELPVTLTEAVLGGRIKVPTPTGVITMTVPKGSNTGTTLRLRGKGAPRHVGGHGGMAQRAVQDQVSAACASLFHSPRSASTARDAGVRVAIASSAKKDELGKYLDIAAIAGLVDETASSEDAEESKPAPDIFQVVLKKLRIEGRDIRCDRRHVLRCVRRGEGRHRHHRRALWRVHGGVTTGSRLRRCVSGAGRAVRPVRRVVTCEVAKAIGGRCGNPPHGIATGA